jgi:hypothetical protein
MKTVAMKPVAMKPVAMRTTGRLAVPLVGLAPGLRRLHAFELQAEVVPGATHYRLLLADSAGNRVIVVSEAPSFDLESVWDALVPGFVRYNTLSYNEGGESTRFGRGGSFLKGRAVHEAAVAPPLMSWEAASRAHYRYLNSLAETTEGGERCPVWVRHAWVYLERGELATVAYPGLHYPFHIWSLLRYRDIDPSSVAATSEMLGAIARTTLACLTPTDWSWGGYVPSTIGELPSQAAWEPPEVIQPLKAAVLAVALLDVPLAEQHPRAHQLAVHIGQQLSTHQRDDGALPFRVNGQTGEWLSGESSALIFALMLWRRLRDLGSGEFEAAERKALRWLLDGPVSTMRWIGNYEDVATTRTDAASTNLNNYDAIMTALFLLEHRDEAPAYLERARALEAWVEEEFAFALPEAPVESQRFVGPVVMEQSTHYYPIDFHAADLARLEWALYDATGDPSYERKASALLDALTHYLDERGRPLTYAPDPDVGYGLSDIVWFGCAAGAWLALSEGAIRRASDRAGRRDDAGVAPPNPSARTGGSAR